jgi:Leucine-rich repeat (LRR) protein
MESSMPLHLEIHPDRLDQFPLKVLQDILSYIPWNEMQPVISLVNKLFSQMTYSVAILHYRNADITKDRLVKAIDFCREKNIEVTALNVSGCENLEELPFLGGISSLKSLNVRGYFKSLEGLNTLTALEELNLGLCSQVKTGMTYLKNWPNLKRLDLELTEVSDADFVPVKHLRQLQDLNLCECMHITQEVFHDVVQHLPSLTTLNLSRFAVRKDEWVIDKTLLGYDIWSPNDPIVRPDDCADISLLTKPFKQGDHWQPFKIAAKKTDWVSNETLASISHLSQLQRLELRCTSITDGGFRYVAHLTHLKYFSVSGCWYFDDRSFEYLTGAKDLRELDVSHCKISQDSMELLHHFPKLEKIHLSGCHGITRQGLEHLGSLPELREVNLSHLVLLKDHNCAFLRTCRKLERITLDFCKDLTNACLEYVKDLRRLEFLSAEGTEMFTNKYAEGAH